MAIIRKIKKITVEIERVSIITQPKRTDKPFCFSCGRQSEFVTLAEALAIPKLTHQEFSELIEQGAIHLVANQEKEILVCLNSVLSLIK